MYQALAAARSVAVYLAVRSPRKCAVTESLRVESIWATAPGTAAGGTYSTSQAASAMSTSTHLAPLMRAPPGSRGADRHRAAPGRWRCHAAHPRDTPRDPPPTSRHAHPAHADRAPG